MSLALVRVDLLTAFRNVARQRRRSGVAIAAVAFGVVSILIANGFVAWVLQQLREGTIHSQTGHFQVMRPGYLEAGRSDPFAYLLPGGAAGEAPRKAVEAVPGLVTLSPRLKFFALISKDEKTISFMGEGVDPAREQSLAHAVHVAQGEALDAGAEDVITLGEGLAAHLGVVPGDRVVLLANTDRGGVNAVEATVRGTFYTPAKAFDDWAARLPLTLAARLLKVDGVHTWTVLLDDTGRTDAVVQALSTQLSAQQYEVVPWHHLADFYNKSVELFSRQTLVVRIIIGVIIVLAIWNALMMAVMERTGEIGTQMALGVNHGRILRQFMFEGLTIGVAGGLVGVLIGTLMAAGISHVGIPMPPPPGMNRGYLAQILVTPSLAFDAWLLAVFTASLASAYPSWRASRLHIVDALRHNR